MTIGERIKARRLYLGMSQEELAEKVGYSSKSTINKIESDVNTKRGLNQTKIMAFAKALNTTPSYIMGWEVDTTPVTLPHPEPVTFVNIYLPLSCGGGMFVDDNIISTISVPTSMLPRSKKDLFAQYASGDSMIGKGIYDGDLLIFSKEGCESGDIGCFCIDENIATCKILKIIEKQILLMPANDKYDPIPVDVERFRCVGKLVLRMNRM